ncbi:glycosyltransferase [Pseudomonas sp. M30-35]|uniref:glycosyltransferase n=1 Tax=Pseudomonas sp. M30-35 TaxID=1981174 RepID=UPI000B3C32BF|nr:glycosyltransferase [Pseudomonas sp. M30-35]ARU86598.1 glycosyltransferase [Pseudomonas sp. M30-35]
MIILISSKITQSNIQASLGKAEYSYYFLLKEFMPALQQIAEVIGVESADQVDRLYQQYREAGEQVVFISVSPPQQTSTDLACPTVCLFAWEFDNVPDEPWEGEPRNDWRYVMQRIAGAIACSQESAEAVRKAMGGNYPVVAIPAPLWPRFQTLMPESGWLPRQPERSIEFTGHVIDSPVLGLSADGLVQHMPRPPLPLLTTAANTGVNWVGHTRALYRAWREALHNRPSARARREKPTAPQHNEIGAKPQECRIEVSGVVFTSVLNPRDGRKNWIDIVTAFCWAFADTTDATLILKMTHHDLEYYRIPLLTLLSRLAPFKCRVLVLHGFLDDQQYRELIQISDFYVNASTCEGLCLPLMEFLASGKPALAPRHTAMLDYLDEQIAYVVKATVEPSCWAHDPCGIFRTRKYRLNWQSLMEGYRECYRIASDDVESYQRMSRHAWQRMCEFADTPVVAEQLQDFLQGLTQSLDRRLAGAQA